MSTKFDIKRFRRTNQASAQYQRQLTRLSDAGKETKCIDQAVQGAAANLRNGGRSFVIYGEPQSGKTEMMICLTAKLLDDGHQLILHLLNDSVDLLNQNLGRFKASGLAPVPTNFSEILDPSVVIRNKPHVIFCKKNPKDLRRISDKIASAGPVVVIDDEADYASPNAKINKGEKTKINELITNLLGSKGIYIGVTATPARLDLNNTFDNDNNLWVDFPPHSKYTGQDDFFPLKAEPKYKLRWLSDSGANPKYPREALFRFLINVAYLNLHINTPSELNYSMLVHTSGKKVDHRNDRGVIRATVDGLQDHGSRQFSEYTETIWRLSREAYPNVDPDDVTRYVLGNIARTAIIILNSERDWKDNASAATSPSSLFTIIIGGNIVSRGVTFDNLLSMFFTRDVKHKIQQDTYIQRARMFGSRGDYLKYFELTIPKALYLDWHRCFVYHRLALNSIKERLGSLVWLSDKRVSAVANSSIDRSTVDLNRGEMSFPIFQYTRTIDTLAEGAHSGSAMMDALVSIIGESAFPGYLRRYIATAMGNGSESVVLHKSSDISGYKDISSAEKLRVTRRKGFFGTTQMEPKRYPKAIHHLKVFHFAEGNARLFYKFAGSIQFMKNTVNE